METNERRWNTSCCRDQMFSIPPRDLPKQYKNLLGSSCTMNAISTKSSTDILPNTLVLGAALLFTQNHTVPSALAMTLSPRHLALPRSSASAWNLSFTKKNGVFSIAEGNFLYRAQLISAHIVLSTKTPNLISKEHMHPDALMNHHSAALRCSWALKHGKYLTWGNAPLQTEQPLKLQRTHSGGRGQRGAQLWYIHQELPFSTGKHQPQRQWVSQYDA